MTTSPPSDAMDPVRLQLLLTGVREAIGDLPERTVRDNGGPRFRRTADSPLFDVLRLDRSTPPDPEDVPAPVSTGNRSSDVVVTPAPFSPPHQ